MKLKIACNNWPEMYPEQPETEVELTRTDERLCIRYSVHGRQLRAMATEDQQPVWEDSCVEFFCRQQGDTYYMNFETNCIGTMVASKRKGRAVDVVPLKSEEMAQIVRRSSLKREQIEEKDGVFDWWVEIEIPFTLLLGGRQPEFPLTLEANFYKCADGTRYPHYLSWQPIDLPKPDFHCPQFFRNLVIE